MSLHFTATKLKIEVDINIVNATVAREVFLNLLITNDTVDKLETKQKILLVFIHFSFNLLECTWFQTLLTWYIIHVTSIR